MATLVELTGGTTTSVASVDTASISPTANRPVFAIVTSLIGGGLPPVVPSVSGAGLTWAQVTDGSRTFTDSVTQTGRVTVFRGVNASPSSGALTLGFSAETQLGIIWTILDGEDCDTVVQTVNAGGDNTAPGATLSAFADSANATLIAVSSCDGAVAYTPDGSLTGFTARTAGGATQRVAWLNAADTTPSFTADVSHAWGVVASEIDNTAAAGPTITAQPTAQKVVRNYDTRTSATFTSAATGATSQNWQEETSIGSGTGSDITNGGIYAGALTDSFTLTPTDNSKSGLRYRNRYTNGSGTTYTDWALLTVKTGPVPSATSGTTNGSGVAAPTYTTDDALDAVAGSFLRAAMTVDGVTEYTATRPAT